MASGVFAAGQSKVRPGTYFRFISEARENLGLGDKGTVIIPIINNWGPNEFITLTNENPNVGFAKLGYNYLDKQLILIREAFKCAKTVIVYNINKGTDDKATINDNSLTATAKYAGARGNDLTVVITENPVKGKDVLIYLDTEVVCKFESLTNIEDIPENPWIDFKGSGELQKAAGLKLKGGTDKTLNNSAVTTFLSEIEKYTADAIAFPFEEESLKTAFASKIKYLREEVGRTVVGVVADLEADYEGIINVVNGVVLKENEAIDKIKATAWVAAASASAQCNQDNTGKTYNGAIAAYPRLSNAETIEGLKKGHFIFTEENQKVKIEEDLNSFVSFTKQKDESYSDNRVIRTFDEIVSLGQKILTPNKYDNDNDGQHLAKQDMGSILTLLQDNHALKNVDIAKDIIIDLVKSNGKSLFASLAVQPTRTYKKYYITVKNR